MLPLPLAPDDSAPCGCGATFKQHALATLEPLLPCPATSCVAFQISDPLPCGHPASSWRDEDLDDTDHFQPGGCIDCNALKEEATP